MVRLYFILLFFVLDAGEIHAQPLSYIYIQGDKKIPFYVLLEGKMTSRYGKNYTIIPELKGGTYNIDVIFQQRVVPSRRFVIDVPENGYRGFLLDKVNDCYELYDLQTKTYLKGSADTTVLKYYKD